jgi:hypothetical protein
MPTEYQIEILEIKLRRMKPDPITGKYSAGYYALYNKIKKLRQDLRNQRWQEFLAK